MQPSFFPFRRKYELRLYEKRLLDAISVRLPDEARRLLASQIAEVNLIQRTVLGKEVVLYSVINGKVFWKDNLLFPNRSDTLPLARCMFESTKIEAQVLIFSGHLGMIQLDSITRELCDDFVSEVHILSDPLNAAGTAARVCVYLDRIALPSDYQRVLNRMKDGARPDIFVYSPEQMRRVLFPDYNYCVLVEIQNKGIIALREDDEAGMLYWFDFDASAFGKIGNLLTSAIHAVYTGGQGII
jgi:hypothetical protein